MFIKIKYNWICYKLVIMIAFIQEQRQEIKTFKKIYIT